MKLLLLFSGLALSVSLAAQYPSSGIKSRLGWQTTGDGLVYRGSGAPAYSPGTMFNAWMYLDTTNYTLYMYRNFQWTKLPLVNNGLTLDGSYVQLGGSLVENTTVSTGTYDLLLGRTSGTNHAWINIYGSGGYAGLFNSYNSGALEAEITAGGGTASLLVENITDGGNSSIYVTKDGFQASYLHPVIGASFFKMDSTKFRIRGLVSYASHSAADAANTEYQIYQINNSRAVYVKNGATTSQDILGTGTTNRVPLWTATNTLSNSNIQDNNAVVSILNSKPFMLGQWTTAGRPTGTAGYEGWNTGGWKEWYNGVRWAVAREASAATGTANRVLFNDANGQITDNGNFSFDAANNRFLVHTSSATDALGLSGTQYGNYNVSNGTSTFSFSFNSNQPYFAVTNGTVRVFGGHANPSDGAVFGSFSNHQLTFRTNNTNRLIISNTGTITSNSPTLTLSTTAFFGSSIVDALGSSQGVFKTVNGSNIFSFSNSAGQPYFAVTNGTQSGYLQPNSADGFRIGSFSAHPTVFVANASEKMRLTTGGLLGLGNINPQRTLHVTGEARITDLTTDTPTQIVGADADGDLGAMSVSAGLSIISGTLGLSADSLNQISGILFVSKNGNNTTAKRNNPRLPFLTIKAAVTASQQGDLIYIYPGVYNEGGNTLGRDSINFYCSPGVSVNNAVITDDYSGADMDNVGYIRWFGSGVFDNCTVSVQHMNMRYHIEGDSINLVYIPFWKQSNYNDIRLKFKFRSVRTKNSQLVWILGKSSELAYTRMNLIFEIDRLYSTESSRTYPLIHFGNGAGGTDSDAKAKLVDCNIIFDIKNIELTGSAAVGSFPRLYGLIFGNSNISGRVHFQRSNLTFNSDYITQMGSAGSTYQSPFQGFENSNTLFGLGTFKLDSSRLNFNIKSIHSDIHAFRIGEFYQGQKGIVNINGNFTTRQLATFHVIETGSGATGDTSVLIRVNGNFSSDKEVISCYSTVPTEKITWSGNYNSFADKAVFAIKSDKFTLSNVVLQNKGTTADIYAAEARTIKIAGAFAENLTVSSNVTANWLDNIGNPKFFGYGVNAKSASALSKTGTNQNAAWATDGTLYEIERKRDTTIFVTADSDYDFSAAVTTAQIGSRYNRVIIHMTLTSGATADKTTTLHTPDANLMQCEFVIRGTDNNGSHTNDISFGTNNAISSDGTNASGYTLSAGQGLHVRVVYNGSAYKYIYY